MNNFPRTADDIIPAWLTARFAANGLLTSGRVVALTECGHRQGACSFPGVLVG